MTCYLGNKEYFIIFFNEKVCFIFYITAYDGAHIKKTKKKMKPSMRDII